MAFASTSGPVALPPVRLIGLLGQFIGMSRSAKREYGEVAVGCLGRNINNNRECQYR